MSRTRLAVLLVLAAVLPVVPASAGVPRTHGGFSGLRVVPRSQGVAVRVRVDNRGPRAAAATDGRLRIRDRAGRIVYRANWRSRVVAAHGRRTVAIGVPRRLAAGVYEIVVMADLGRSRDRRVVSRFRIRAPRPAAPARRPRVPERARHEDASPSTSTEGLIALGGVGLFLAALAAVVLTGRRRR